METEYDLGISMNFDNMVFIIDPNNTSVNEVSGKESYGGEFYFFYGKNEETGNYEYGGLPNYEQAKAEGVVKDIDKNATPDEPASKPTDPSNNNNNTNPTTTVPAPDQNATSATNAVSTSDTANNTDNNAVQTGATTAAAVLAVLLVAGGAVVYTRKRFE